MRKAFSRRVVFVLVSVFIAVVFYFSFGEKPNSAQAVRTVEPKAKFEQFSRPDLITGDIRDRSKEIVRVQFHSIADRENVTKYGRIVQDFGSSVVLAKS